MSSRGTEHAADFSGAFYPSVSTNLQHDFVGKTRCATFRAAVIGAVENFVGEIPGHCIPAQVHGVDATGITTPVGGDITNGGRTIHQSADVSMGIQALLVYPNLTVSFAGKAEWPNQAVLFGIGNCDVVDESKWGAIRRFSHFEDPVSPGSMPNEAGEFKT